jgi:hypothetical protein
MDDELRKAAQDFADSVDGYENDLPLSAIRAKGALRAALAKNANAAPDVSTSKTILVGRYIRENGLDSQCFTYPDGLPDGQYEMYLRNLTSDCKTYSGQLPGVCQMQASLDDKRDAERYRFMQGNESIKFWDGLGALHPSEWDEFIDAAMQQEQKP